MNPENFTFIDLFAGIGGIRLALETQGGNCVFSSEWEPIAQQTYARNFHELPAGDITKIPSSEIPDHDVLAGGFPCQPFSIIGDRLGFEDTRGTLFFEIERILRDKAPHAFLLENVKQLTTIDRGRTMRVILDSLKELGYFTHWAVLNALDFGLPQKRERVFIVGFKRNYPFRFPIGPTDGKRLKLEDILEADEEIDPRWFASEKIRMSRRSAVENKTVFFPSIWHENKGGNVSVLPYSCALRAGASFSYLLVNGERRLTPREQLRLQGFPESFTVCGSESQIRHQTGNSVAVPVVKAIAARMMEAIQLGEDAKPEAVVQVPLFELAESDQ